MGGKFRKAMSVKAGKELTIEEAKDFKAKMDAEAEKKAKAIEEAKKNVAEAKAELETAQKNNEEESVQETLHENLDNAEKALAELTEEE